MGCPNGALRLAPVSAEEWFHVPSSFIEWEERRLKFLSSQNWRVAGENITQNDEHK
jgi:hypothetical protein